VYLPHLRQPCLHAILANLVAVAPFPAVRIELSKRKQRTCANKLVLTSHKPLVYRSSVWKMFHLVNPNGPDAAKPGRFSFGPRGRYKVQALFMG